MEKPVILLILLLSIVIGLSIFPVIAHTGDNVDDGHHDGMGRMNFDFLLTPWVLMMFMGMIIHLFLVYWVYQDAVNKELTNPLLWAIVVLFTSFMGFIIYLLVNSTTNQTLKTSPNMELKYSSTNKSTAKTIPFDKEYHNAAFCKVCGAPVEENTIYCSNCGAQI